MKRTRLIILFAILIAALLATAYFAGSRHCPSDGLALTQQTRAFYRLKNRTAPPQPTDFDSSVTLERLLLPGEDRARWSTSRAARVEGYVVSVAAGPLEFTNCYVPSRRDTHIHIGLRPDSPPSEQVVLETTPRMEDWARDQGWDWSAVSLYDKLLGRRVRFEGWLFFDTSHAGESENIAPGRAGNWRATAWEIHPVTKFEIIE
jgi:hypothetical protein